jgi:hypothetical protein
MAESTTADTMRKRNDEAGLVGRLLLDWNRFVVTALLGLAAFVGFMLFSVALAPPLSLRIQSTDTVETLFAALIGVLVTGTTLVVTISQLVLAQENGPLGDQRQRMEGAMDFRDYTADMIDGVVPVEPAAFLSAIVASVERRSEAVHRLAAESDDDGLREDAASLNDDIQENTASVRGTLDGAEFGSFDVLRAALDVDYSWKIYRVELLKEEHGAAIDEPLGEALAELRTAVTMYGPAREHIKTLYFQWALIDLSKYILGLAVVALVVAGGMLTFVDAATFGPARFLGLPVLTWVVGITFTICLLPFFLFISYIFRIVVVAKRTLAIGPLVLRATDQ